MWTLGFEPAPRNSDQQQIDAGSKSQMSTHMRSEGGGRGWWSFLLANEVRIGLAGHYFSFLLSIGQSILTFAGNRKTDHHTVSSLHILLGWSSGLEVESISFIYNHGTRPRPDQTMSNRVRKKETERPSTFPEWLASTGMVTWFHYVLLACHFQEGCRSGYQGIHINDGCLWSSRRCRVFTLA